VAKKIDARPGDAWAYGPTVPSGEPEMQLHERHDAKRFDTKTSRQNRRLKTTASCRPVAAGRLSYKYSQVFLDVLTSNLFLTLFISFTQIGRSLHDFYRQPRARLSLVAKRLPYPAFCRSQLNLLFCTSLTTLTSVCIRTLRRAIRHHASTASEGKAILASVPCVAAGGRETLLRTY